MPQDLSFDLSNFRGQASGLSLDKLGIYPTDFLFTATLPTLSDRVLVPPERELRLRVGSTDDCGRLAEAETSDNEIATFHPLR